MQSNSYWKYDIYPHLFDFNFTYPNTHLLAFNISKKGIWNRHNIREKDPLDTYFFITLGYRFLIRSSDFLKIKYYVYVNYQATYSEIKLSVVVSYLNI